MGTLAPNVLIGIPNIDSGNLLTRQLSDAGCRVARAENISECITTLRERKFELIVIDVSLNGCEGIHALNHFRNTDEYLSGTPFIFTSDKQLSSEELKSAKRAGAWDFIEMPLNPAKIEQLLRLALERCSEQGSENGASKPVNGRVNKMSELQSIVNGNRDAPLENGNRITSEQMAVRASGEVAAERSVELEQILVGESPSIAAIRQLILEVATTRASVMIYGEAGTGKELVAQTIHRFSKHADGPFIPVNMATIPRGFADSLLFGDATGESGSSAHRQTSWCEAANGGTLFLDEVGEMELHIQPKLLRLLQEGTYQRAGSQVSHPVSVRVITATNRDPGSIVSEGRVREDLFFRLHVVPIYMPPLRERPEDIPALADMFLRRAASRHERTVDGFSKDAMRVLQQHDWPGNVRQLETTIERLVIFARNRVIEADQIPADDHLASAYAERRRALAGGNVGHANGDDFDPLVNLTPIERHERGAIVDALRRVDGRVVDAARLLGLGQATIYRKIKQYSIPHERRRRVKRPK
jgi:DNA-binding NtrC family response regulator